MSHWQHRHCYLYKVFFWSSMLSIYLAHRHLYVRTKSAPRVKILSGRAAHMVSWWPIHAFKLRAVHCARLSSA